MVVAEEELAAVVVPEVEVGQEARLEEVGGGVPPVALSVQQSDGGTEARPVNHGSALARKLVAWSTGDNQRDEAANNRPRVAPARGNGVRVRTTARSAGCAELSRTGLPSHRRQGRALRADRTALARTPASEPRPKRLPSLRISDDRAP